MFEGECFDAEAGTMKRVAVKEHRIELTDPPVVKRRALDELEFFQAIQDKLGQHPCIVRFYGAIKRGDGKYDAVLELAEFGDLRKFLRNRPYERKQRLSICAQLARAITFLRDKHVAHRDLKPENIVVTNTYQQPVIKLADFGAYTALAHDTHVHEVCSSWACTLSIGPIDLHACVESALLADTRYMHKHEMLRRRAICI